MPLRWKIDITESLKVKGYSSYKIRKEKLFGQKTLQDFRDGTVVLSYDLLEKLCALLECQPGDLLEYVASKDDDSEYVYDLVSVYVPYESGSRPDIYFDLGDFSYDFIFINP